MIMLQASFRPLYCDQYIQIVHDCYTGKPRRQPSTDFSTPRNVFKVASCKISPPIVIFGTGSCCCSRVYCPAADSSTYHLASPSTDTCTSKSHCPVERRMLPLMSTANISRLQGSCLYLVEWHPTLHDATTNGVDQQCSPRPYCH